MIVPFSFDNYRAFVKARISEMPNSGFGVLSQLAKKLHVHPTLVSQIFKGTKNLTGDQAILTASFFALSETETEYFVLLVQLDRAGHEAARQFYRRQLRSLAHQAQDVSKRVSIATRLTDEQRAIFYSDWAYSAVRQCIALKNFDNIEAIAAKLNLAPRKVKVVLDFLVAAGLCRISKGRLTTGPASTHLEATSPWIRAHHTNWRAKALESLDKDRSDDLHYTSPLTLSVRDANVIKELLIRSVENVNNVVDPSPSEAIYCLNVDWFEIGR